MNCAATNLFVAVYLRLVPIVALDELEMLIKNMSPKEPVIFRANHGSNAYPIGGMFPEDKDAMLQKISHLRKHPELCRPAGLRGF